MSRPLPLTPQERRFIEELARWQARKDLAAADALLAEALQRPCRRPETNG